MRLPRPGQGCSDGRARLVKALAAVIQEAYLHGVSVRSMDDLVQAMDMSGISKVRSDGSAARSASG
jgi:putative transposase